MKKILLSALMFVAIAFGVGAAELITNSNSAIFEASLAQERVYYDGPAYSVDGGIIKKPKNSVQVRWTDNGCTVEGQRNQTVFSAQNSGIVISFGGGDLRTMTHYVNYKGVKYYFAL